MNKKFNTVWVFLFLTMLFGTLQAQLGPCNEGIGDIANILVIPMNDSLKLAKSAKSMASMVIGELLRVPAETRVEFMDMVNNTAYYRDWFVGVNALLVPTQEIETWSTKI